MTFQTVRHYKENSTLGRERGRQNRVVSRRENQSNCTIAKRERVVVIAHPLSLPAQHTHSPPEKTLPTQWNNKARTKERSTDKTVLALVCVKKLFLITKAFLLKRKINDSFIHSFIQCDLRHWSTKHVLYSSKCHAIINGQTCMSNTLH